MAQTEDVLAEYVERLFEKASLLSLAVLGHGRCWRMAACVQTATAWISSSRWPPSWSSASA